MSVTSISKHANRHVPSGERIATGISIEKAPQKHIDNGCQNIVPLFGRYLVKTTYAVILFSEQIYGKRYNA
jgi:hypothetical protein